MYPQTASTCTGRAGTALTLTLTPTLTLALPLPLPLPLTRYVRFMGSEEIVSLFPGVPLPVTFAGPCRLAAIANTARLRATHAPYPAAAAAPSASDSGPPNYRGGGQAGQACLLTSNPNTQP